MSELFIGLMSGTSSDGIDAALVEFQPAPRLCGTHFAAYPESLRAQLLDFASGRYRGDPVDELGALDTQLGEAFAAAALALIREARISASNIRAIGSHGQTVRHRPGSSHPFTLQIADPNIIAARTGIATVADFRRRDLALGGEGAPLMPAFHRAAFGDSREFRALVNIGGIANVSLLAPDGGVSGFDTGPGNVLLDFWSRERFGKPCDENGALAAGGRMQAELLEKLLDDDYFRRPPPKSTGREHFSPAWLMAKLNDAKLSDADVLASLTELTATSIGQAIRVSAPSTARVFLCGGGAHNRHLVARLASQLPGIPVLTTEALGLHPDWVEAAGFAWLARETLAGRPGNLPAVTGARQPTVLGAIYPV